MQIELFLSTDGKQTVHVSAPTVEQMNELAPYARALYEKVLNEYGTKAQMWEPVMNGQSNGQARRQRANGEANGQSREDAPHCPEHGTPMALRNGRYGRFFSCARKMPDGTWCKRTAKVVRQDDGQHQPSLHAQA